MEEVKTRIKIALIKCDFSNPEHITAVKILINEYIIDPMGGGSLHNKKKQDQLIEGLKYHPTVFLFLAYYENEYAGLILSFENFSTFMVRKMINIHDIIVKEKFRNKGIGKALLYGVIEEAKKRNCGKITLEVRKDNSIAQSIYREADFSISHPPMLFLTKYIEG